VKIFSTSSTIIWSREIKVFVWFCNYVWGPLLHELGILLVLCIAVNHIRNNIA
jgi:hypothetical protein